jgi:outer membrane receptor protein involved in Fe transport
LNALVTYRKKLTSKLNLRLQLNIQNLLDDLEPQAVSGGQPANLATNTLPLIDGVAYNIQLPEPRRYAVSASFEF